jgi:uncharacterized hydrophobic protein (TIGR00341 family)
LSESNGNRVGKLLGHQLSPEERREVVEDLFVFGKEKQRPFLVRMAVLLVISTVIASAGLLADSAAVVIGAMLVAPLMRPVMSASAAVTLGWTRRLYQSLILTWCMAIAAVMIAAGIASLAPHMIDIPAQVMARAEPTFFDLVIALAAGAGGAYVMTRKESSSIPGVAIAVALLPPLASCGILIVFLQNELALKAFVLFLTNFAAMVLTGVLTFLAVGISPAGTRERSARVIRISLLVFTVLVVAISVPLYFYSTEVWYDATYKANQSEELQAWLAEHDLTIDAVRIDDERQILYLQLLGPDPPLDIETLHTELAKKQKEVKGENTPFRIEVGWTQQNRFSWPPTPGEEQEERQLIRDFSDQLRKFLWFWVGTQYADGNWLRPEEENAYFFLLTNETGITVATSCDKETGGYELRQENISIEVDVSQYEDCPESKTDERFVSDLSEVIHLGLDDDRLSLRLANDTGVMYFEGKRL